LATRLLILGTSGSGKSTLAARLAGRLKLRHVELDAIRHQAHWVEMPDAQFRQVVARATAEENWIIDGNYGIVRDLVLARATAVIWLDPPRWRVMWQVILRSLHRAITRQPLWNGNRERFWNWLDGDHPIRWAWHTHRRYRQEFQRQMQPHWVRLRSHADEQRWLESLRPEGN